jgi:transmembrane sensor
MKSSHHKPDSIAEEEAALWAARLDGDTLDRTQRGDLDTWLARDPAHRSLLSEYCQFSADLEEQVHALAAAGVVSVKALDAPKKRVRSRWSFPRVTGVALAAAATIAIATLVFRPAPEIENIAMASAQRGSHTLADGTRVELNANTSLRFENSRSERRVRLAAGEALFIVAKDPSRPFFVETPAGSVRVTGTTFNVRSEPSRNGFEVTVIEGSVQVRPGALNGASSRAPLSLGARDQFSSRLEGVRSLSADQLQDVLAWRRGAIVFYDVPLKDAAARFAQYHGMAIHVSPDVAEERIGSTHSLDDLEGFLAAIEVALPVARHRDSSGAVLLSRRQ